MGRCSSRFTSNPCVANGLDLFGTHDCRLKVPLNSLIKVPVKDRQDDILITIVEDVVDLKPLIDDVCRDDDSILLITIKVFDKIIGKTDPDIIDARHQNGMSSSVVGATLDTGAAGVALALWERAGMTLGVLGAFVSCQPLRPLDSHRPR